MSSFERRAQRKAFRKALKRAQGPALIVMAALVLGYFAALPRVDYPKAVGYVAEGPVSHYRDGDTIEVNGMAIRLARLDCPEMSMDEGARAKWAVIELTRGKALSCTFTGERTYDRWVATCLLPDGRTVSRAMVQGGYCSRYGLPNFRPVSKEALLHGE